MNTKLYPPILYLEQSNFKGNTLLPIVNPISNRPLFLNTVVILFQGNGCGHCTHFKPVYQTVANELHQTVDFATVQVENSDISFEKILPFPIEGIPTIVKFRKGVFSELYNGNRSYEDFKNWALH